MVKAPKLSVELRSPVAWQAAEKLTINQEVTKTRRKCLSRTKHTNPVGILVPWCLYGELLFPHNAKAQIEVTARNEASGICWPHSLSLEFVIC
jgi:hypothetical protein